MDLTQIKKKIDNFWYYYKWHTIFAVPVIITIIFVMSPGKAPVKKYNCNALFTGSYFDDSKRIKLESEGKLNINFLPMGQGVSKDIENSSLQKIMGGTAAGEYDLVVTDKEHFDTLAKEGTFLQLDDLVKMNNLESKGLNLIKEKTDSDNSEHIYGIELKENKDLQAARYDVKNKVVGVYANTRENNRAITFISILFNNFNQ